MLKIQQVRQFVIAATSGSFKGAASATFRSQAAVSIAMRELEKAIGAPLIERDHRGRFTPLARALLPMFQDLLTVHDRVYRQSRQMALGEHGSLSVAVAPFLAEHWLPDLIAEFAEQHPDIRIRTIEERSSRIGGLVNDGMATIGVAGLLSDNANLNIRPIAIDSYGVICSRDHPLARKRMVTWASLQGETLIGSDTTEMLSAAGLAGGLQPPQLVITSRSPLLACVRKNLGISIVAMITRPPPDRGIVFVPLVRPKLTRLVSIVTRNSETMTPAGKLLEKLVAGSLREFALRQGAKPATAKTRF